MNKRQSEKKFGRPGTKRTRKQWAKAIARGKMPNQHLKQDQE